MKLRRTFRVLALTAGLLSAGFSYGRGGETGTLDEDEGAVRVAIGSGRGTLNPWAPFFIKRDHFRRLRARLMLQSLAPIPGWNSRQAWRFEDRYFTEDGVHEILPLLTDPVR